MEKRYNNKVIKNKNGQVRSGWINCTLIFIILLLLGHAKVESWQTRMTTPQVSWIFVFVLVAIAEEIMNRSFLMFVLRRVDLNLYCNISNSITTTSPFVKGVDLNTCYASSVSDYIINYI